MTRRLLPVLLLVLALTGCDSNSSNSVFSAIEGDYRVAELVFVPDGSGVTEANVTSRLVESQTRLTIFNADDPALLTSQFAGQALERTDLKVTATRGTVTLRPVSGGDRTDLQRLLLPDDIRLEYDPEAPGALSTPGGGIAATVDLYAYDPAVYNSGLRAVPGKLRIRFARI